MKNKKHSYPIKRCVLFNAHCHHLWPLCRVTEMILLKKAEIKILKTIWCPKISHETY